MTGAYVRLTVDARRETILAVRAAILLSRLTSHVTERRLSDAVATSADASATAAANDTPEVAANASILLVLLAQTQPDVAAEPAAQLVELALGADDDVTRVVLNHVQLQRHLVAEEDATDVALLEADRALVVISQTTATLPRTC